MTRTRQPGGRWGTRETTASRPIRELECGWCRIELIETPGGKLLHREKPLTQHPPLPIPQYA